MRQPNRPVKVLHIATVPITALTFIAPLAAHLEHRGFDVAIACSSGSRAESGTVLETLRARFRVFTIPIPRTIRPLLALYAIWDLYRLIRREKFDIVHTQTAQAGFLGRLAARLAGTPVIVHTAHAFPFHEQLPEALRRLYAFLERWVARWSDLILVDTEAVRAEGLRYRVTPPHKILTVHMGVELDRFNPNGIDRDAVRRMWGMPPAAVVVGTVARLVPEKGIDDLLRAAAPLARRWPQLRLLIVGDGPARSALERQARDLSIVDRVVFAGVRTDIPTQLTAMDLFVLPSRREGFGVVFAEAMAMRIPVVGSDIGSVREVVEDGKTGVLVPSQDLPRLADAIDRLLADPARRESMGAAGRRRVEQHFDARIMYERTEAIYRKLLEERGHLPLPPRFWPRTIA